MISDELRLKIKRANQRLVRLERYKIEVPALKSAKNIINRKFPRADEKVRFPSGKNFSDEGLERLENAVDKFLNYRSSTVTGYKSIVKEGASFLQTQYNDLTDKQALAVYKLMQTDDFNISKELISSEMLRVMIIESVQNGNDYNNVLTALQRFNNATHDKFALDQLRELLGNATF